MGFLSRFFKVGDSKKKAKERLQLVLIHDRADISAGMMEMLRKDIIEVISRYMEIDESQIELELEKENKSVALVANIPIVKVKRNYRNVKTSSNKGE
ncbi:cell division topological specificity factor MinE [Thermovirga sp.]|uniref:cell division topological specificity factor MinE n=1 Tax=Thermovirga sp. TaxID=2699834 RepID=UPI0025D2CE06|nr:cell division topological specificity factor MinE [Thermovirga sp.]MBO8154167.1 cell division topological specificity factor MinE [Thermovirga sp.]